MKTAITNGSDGPMPVTDDSPPFYEGNPMIHSLEGDGTLRGDLAALFAISAPLTVDYIERQMRGNRFYHLGVPFFDELDFYTKSLALNDVANGLLDSPARFPETAWHAAALTAMCVNIEQIVLREIEKRDWPRSKYGVKTIPFRDMVRAAYRSCYPERPRDTWIAYDDAFGYLQLVKQLTVGIRPAEHFLLADMEPEERKRLLRRERIPRDYFTMPFRIEKMTKTAMRERSRAILLNMSIHCMAVATKRSTMVALSAMFKTAARG